MSTLTTKATIALTSATAGLAAAASPALADDAVTAAVTPAETVAHALRGGGLVLAAMAGVVLLSKAAHGYRRSQWRRRWILRSTALYVGSPQLGWPSGSISGRAARPLLPRTTMAAAPSARTHQPA